MATFWANYFWSFLLIWPPSYLVKERGFSLSKMATVGLMGSAAGALSVRYIGAVEGLLPRAEIENWMTRTPLRRASD